MITGPDIESLLPLEILGGGMLFTMLAVAVKRNHTLTFICTLTTLAAAFLSVLYIWPAAAGAQSVPFKAPHPIGDLFLIDRFGCYFQALILLSAFVVTLFSQISLKKLFPEKRKEEYYLLLLLATLGGASMVISTHFLSFFIGLEILNISLYTLISYYRERPKAIEAGLKYLVLAAMSSAFLLFGMALIYTLTGTLSFEGLAVTTAHHDPTSATILIPGIGLMIIGMGFKLALVPFHMWAPDIYEGASSPASAFIATVSKGAMMAVLLRFFAMADLYGYKQIMLVFTVIAILSMLTGNLLALRQNNIKRLLAYSSIAHFGYILVAFIAGKGMGTQAATFYLTAYIITILAAFSLITLMSRSDNEATDIEDYAGLFWKKPLLATLFSITLLSLAGIPLTAGFMGKFYLLSAGVGNGNWLLAFALVVSSVIGLYYYLRFIFAMMKTTGKNFPIDSYRSLTGLFVLSLLGAAILCLGVFPAWLVSLVSSLT
jgi:NADH-quinone oxidoreductase subunit N